MVGVGNISICLGLLIFILCMGRRVSVLGLMKVYYVVVVVCREMGEKCFIGDDGGGIYWCMLLNGEKWCENSWWLKCVFIFF